MALLLVSTVSAMILAGPRVLHALGEDYRLFRWLGHHNADGIPARAVMLQALLSLVFLWSSSFESILVFSGMTMGLNTFFSVLGLFVRRYRGQRSGHYEVPLYPLPPLLFLLVTGWALAYTALARPQEAVFSVVVIFSGALLYLVSHLSERGSAK